MDHTAWYAIPAPSVLTKGRIGPDLLAVLTSGRTYGCVVTG